MSRPPPLLLALIILAVGCGGDDGPLDDAGAADGGSGDAGFEGAAPPELPGMTPCPEGWREVGEAPAICEPWPEGGPLDCGPGEAHFPGAPACARIGTACPAGEWAEDLPADVPVLRVSATAPTGGDGSVAAPFAAVDEAVAAAAPTTVIAVGRGTFTGAVRLSAGLTLLGACVSETHITTDVPSSLRGAAVVSTRASNVVVRNLRISGADKGVAFEGDGVTGGRLEHVLVEGATSAGWVVGPGAQVTGQNVVVRDTAPASDGLFGHGLAVGPRSDVQAESIVFERNRSSAIAVLEAHVGLVDLAVRDTDSNLLDLRQGMALEVLGGANVEVERAALEGNRDRALMVSEPGTTLAMSRSVIRGTRSRLSDRSEGRGLFAFDGAQVELTQVLFGGNRELGLMIADESTTTALADVVVRGTLGRERDDLFGGGLAAQGGATVTAARTLLSGNLGIGAFAGSGSTLSLMDATVLDTESEGATGRFGVALQAQGGARVDGARIVVERSRQAALTAAEMGTVLTLSDLRVTDTRERACAATDCPDLGFGDGLISTLDAWIEVSRFVVGGSARAGVVIAGGTMDLHAGEIVGNPIGANVQTPGFDVMRISDGVAFRDNDRNLDMSALPLPEPSTGF